MRLAAGAKLGPYEIVSPLGAGGMGEVYKARDSRLEREIAIKILPSHLSSNPDLKQRFEREANSLAVRGPYANNGPKALIGQHLEPSPGPPLVSAFAMVGQVCAPVALPGISSPGQ